jgi:tetratricopeptide (TPR) repeat protein
VDSTPGMGTYLTLFPLDTAVISHSEHILGTLMRQASSANERRDAIRSRLVVLWNSGRPVEAARWVDSLSAYGEQPWLVVQHRVLSPTLYGGDWVSPVMYPPAGDDHPSVLFASEAARLARGDAASVNRSTASIRRQAATGETANEDLLRMATVLDAWASVVRNAPDARAVVQTADSAVRGWQTNNQVYSLVVGRAWFELGEFDRALTAIRRRYNTLGFPSANGYAEALRLEGKIAAKTGDRAGAILAYQRYLRLRRDPEAVMKPQRDSVVAELAALER